MPWRGWLVFKALILLIFLIKELETAKKRIAIVLEERKNDKKKY
jgi:hypothetical protein